ncbi:MAG TPA: EamA family transporter [Beijerinckiaceae bacterium]|jgi:drug/metabolite transporter (DMT)-like permease
MSASPLSSRAAAALPTARLPDYALLVLLASVWGASYTFIKLGVETIPPVTLIAARTLIAGLILAGIMRVRGVRWPRDRATWRSFLIQACLNSVVPFTLIAWAELTVEAGTAAILNATTPIFTFLITWGLTRHEPATGRKLLGVTAGLVGTCLVIGPQALQGLGREFTSQLAIVAATICYAFAAIYGRRFSTIDPTVPAAGSLLAGAALLIPISLILDRPWTLAPSQSSVLALIGLATVSTALAFTIYFRLIRTLGSVATTAQGYLRVPVGVAIGVMALGEALAPTVWIGLAFTLVGVVAMTFPAAKGR